MNQLRVVEVDGGGRRRARSGGRLQVLSDQGSEYALTKPRGLGGSSDDKEHDGANHEGRASPTAAELKL